MQTKVTQPLPKEVELAIGRLLRVGSRPTQPGDIEEYERCRAIIMGWDAVQDASHL